MGKQKLASLPKPKAGAKGKGAAKRKGGAKAPAKSKRPTKAKAPSKAKEEKADTSIAPPDADPPTTTMPRLILKLPLRGAATGDHTTNEDNTANEGRGKRIKNIVRYDEAMVAEQGGEDEDEYITEAETVAQFDSQGEEIEEDSDDVAFSTHFIYSIDQDIINFYHDLVAQTAIQPELPDIYKPSEDPQHANDDLYDIRLPWTSEKLFHLYILAYSQDAYHICDLIADTWIWAFQRTDSDPETRIWRLNQTDYKQREDVGGSCDHFTTLVDRHVTSFEFNRLRELYENTQRGCGARLLWADSLALCTAWLEEKMDASKMLKKWHPELMWDVLRTSLRMSGVRLTLKIEEKNQEAWCERYHEHPKHDAPCYRKLVDQQTAAEAEEQAAVDAARKAAKSKAGGERMEIDGANEHDDSE